MVLGFWRGFKDNFVSEELRVKNVLSCLENLGKDEIPFNGLLDYARTYFNEMSERRFLPEGYAVNFGVY